MNETELILTSLLECRRVDLYIDKPQLTLEQQNRYDEICARRKRQEPLQYLLGECEFCGLNLKVDPRALIPRPETELLVEEAVQEARALNKDFLKILELGTGSGNIAVSLAKRLPNSTIISVDVSDAALALARENVSRHGCQDQVMLLCQELRDALREGRQQGGYDLIVSNPPYVPREDLADLPADVLCEPRSALDGGPQGMDLLTEIIGRAAECLNPAGVLVLEIGDGQRGAVDAALVKAKFEKVRFVKDFSQTDRIVIARKSRIC